MNARKPRFPLVYMVTRTDTHSGMAIRANDAEHAARRALRYAAMKGATTLKVAGFCHREAARLIDVAN
jgi:hypothetical protein